MRYRIEPKLMGYGSAEWGLFVEINGIWLLHQSYTSKKQAEQALRSLADKLSSYKPPGGISEISS